MFEYSSFHEFICSSVWAKMIRANIFHSIRILYSFWSNRNTTGCLLKQNTNDYMIYQVFCEYLNPTFFFFVLFLNQLRNYCALLLSLAAGDVKKKKPKKNTQKKRSMIICYESMLRRKSLNPVFLHWILFCSNLYQFFLYMSTLKMHTIMSSFISFQNTVEAASVTLVCAYPQIKQWMTPQPILEGLISGNFNLPESITPNWKDIFKQFLGKWWLKNNYNSKRKDNKHNSFLQYLHILW